MADGEMGPDDWGGLDFLDDLDRDPDPDHILGPWPPPSKPRGAGPCRDSEYRPGWCIHHGAQIEFVGHVVAQAIGAPEVFGREPERLGRRWGRCSAAAEIDECKSAEQEREVSASWRCDKRCPHWVDRDKDGDHACMHPDVHPARLVGAEPVGQGPGVRIFYESAAVPPWCPRKHPGEAVSVLTVCGVCRRGYDDAERNSRLGMCFTCAHFLRTSPPSSQAPIPGALPAGTVLVVEREDGPSGWPNQPTRSNPIRMMYTVGDEPDPSRIGLDRSFLGCGGQGFLVEMADGRTGITHNLWCAGKIPRVLWDRLPVNATVTDCGKLTLADVAQLLREKAKREILED